MAAPEPPRVPPGPHAPPSVEAFVARIKAGTVARKGRGRWLVWGLTLGVVLAIWFLARPWLTTSAEGADEGSTGFLADGGVAFLQFFAYLLLGLAFVAVLFALHAMWMLLFELAMPRYLRISAEGIELARGLRRVRFAWPRIASIDIIHGPGSKSRSTLVLRPRFDYTAPDPFIGQRLSWSTARSPWRDKSTDTIGLCRLDELNTTPVSYKHL
ncbi:hypothetical protein, partial [Nonomuraea zeae]